MPPKSKTPAAEPEIAEEQVEAAPEAAEPAAEQQPEPEAEAQPESAAEEAPEADDGELAEINAALRPMKAADGSEGSCDLYKSDKAGNILVPASDVPAMLEHGFVLVDDDA